MRYLPLFIAGIILALILVRIIEGRRTKIWLYLLSVIVAILFMALSIMLAITFNTQSNINKVEHIKTGDIDWVCIDNGDYTRSCDVIQKYQ